jgi:hypothetical protein
MKRDAHAHPRERGARIPSVPVHTVMKPITVSVVVDHHRRRREAAHHRHLYTLAPAHGGGTLVTFTFAWERAPLTDRLAAPLVRAYLRRGNERSLQRLKALLERKAADGPTVAEAA